MNDREENKLTNFLTRQAILEKPEHAAAVASVPVLGEALGEWSGVVALIQTLGNAQGTQIVGITESKNNLRQLMTKRALIVRNKVGPFAARTGDAVLAGKVAITPSDFFNARDTAADDLAIQILAAATPHEAALVAGYGLKATQLDDLESAVIGYSALIGAPTAAIKVRKSTTEQIDAEFAAADKLLDEQIDPLVQSLELEFPTFVAEYAAAKKIGGRPGETATNAAEPAPA